MEKPCSIFQEKQKTLRKLVPWIICKNLIAFYCSKNILSVIDRLRRRTLERSRDCALSNIKSFRRTLCWISLGSSRETFPFKIRSLPNELKLFIMPRRPKLFLRSAPAISLRSKSQRRWEEEIAERPFQSRASFIAHPRARLENEATGESCELWTCGSMSGNRELPRAHCPEIRLPYYYNGWRPHKFKGGMAVRPPVANDTKPLTD